MQHHSQSATCLSLLTLAEMFLPDVQENVKSQTLYCKVGHLQTGISFDFMTP
jgi:hypothetical protein